MRKQSESYEVTTGKTEVAHIAKERSIQIKGMGTDNEFWSDDITIDGQTENRGSNLRFSRTEAKKDYWKKRNTEEIQGLRCPDCDAQAYKTDQKDVAVCGDYPGWYFFYRKIDQEADNKSSVKMVLRNGEYVMVEDEGTELIKDAL